MKVVVIGSHLCPDTLYAPVKAAGRLGIPLFELEDGTKTFDLNLVLDRAE